MWDYKVIAGVYSVDGSDVVVENPLGKGTLQRILDHYGNEGYELASSHYDNINREIVVLLKRPRGSGGPAPQASSAAAAMTEPAPTGAKSQGGRRSKAELDRLYRDS